MIRKESFPDVFTVLLRTLGRSIRIRGPFEFFR